MTSDAEGKDRAVLQAYLLAMVEAIEHDQWEEEDLLVHQGDCIVLDGVPLQTVR